MPTKQVTDFIKHLDEFLGNPDIDPLYEIKPVYEAGSWALHMFLDDDLQTQVLTEWNATRPYYMGDWTISDRHCYSELRVRLPGEEGANRDERYLHLSLEQISQVNRINYGSTRFFTGIAAMVDMGMYRANDERNYVEHNLFRGDIKTPSLILAQLEQYLKLSQQFSWVHMNPGARKQPTSIRPVQENGVYGLHIFHPDPAVLELMRVLNNDRYPTMRRGGTSKTCRAGTDTPYLHLNLGLVGWYLVNTPYFERVR